MVVKIGKGDNEIEDIEERRRCGRLRLRRRGANLVVEEVDFEKEEEDRDGGRLWKLEKVEGD